MAKKKMTYSLDIEIIKKITRLASNKGLSSSSYLNMLIKEMKEPKEK